MKKISRKELDLPEEKRFIAIVGNRLDIEIQPEYIQFIDEVLKLDDSLAIVFIGSFDDFNNFVDKSNYGSRFFSIGYQSELLSVFENMYLYLNLPRLGGGFSALMALKAGVPVITLPGCDVSNNVGEDFICANEQEELIVIKKYITDLEYYASQKQKGIHKTTVSDEKIINKFSEFINQIIHVIKVIEKRDRR